MSPRPARSDRVPRARPAGDGHERNRGTSATFDGRDGATFDGRDGATFGVQAGAALYGHLSTHIDDDEASFRDYDDALFQHGDATYHNDGASFRDYGTEARRDGNGCSNTERGESP